MDGVPRDKPSPGTVCVHESSEFSERQFLWIIQYSSQLLNFKILDHKQLGLLEGRLHQHSGKNLKAWIQILFEKGYCKNGRIPIDGNVQNGCHRFQCLINFVAGHAESSPSPHGRRSQLRQSFSADRVIDATRPDDGPDLNQRELLVREKIQMHAIFQMDFLHTRRFKCERLILNLVRIHHCSIRHRY